MKIESQFELTKRSEAMKGGTRSSLGQKASTLADASGACGLRVLTAESCKCI